MYIHIITTIALHLIDEINGPVNLNTLTRDVEDIVNFEIELARVSETLLYSFKAIRIV